MPLDHVRCPDIRPVSHFRLSPQCKLMNFDYLFFFCALEIFILRIKRSISRIVSAKPSREFSTRHPSLRLKFGKHEIPPTLFASW